MKVGLHIRYQRCETTWVALQLASWLRSTGKKCSVLSFGARGQSVHPDWDQEVQTDYSVDYDEWLRSCTHVMWFYDVCIPAVIAAKRRQIKTLMVASWDDPILLADVYRLVDYIVCLSPSLAHRLRAEPQFKRNIAYVPADMPLLPARSSLIIRPDRPKVLLNLRGPRKQQLGKCLSKTVSRWFHQIPAEWTIWVPKNLTHKKAWVNKCLRSPHKDSSFRYITDASWDSQRLLYGWHDVTIWPTIRGGHGLTPIFSLLMGTPIVGFDVPPGNEYVSKENAMMVPCQVEYNKVGNAKLTPDLDRFEIAVNRVLTQRDILSKLKDHTSDWTEERRKLFVKGWTNILE